MMKHENASMSPARHPVRAIVLAPTRELAIQVADNVKTYASKCNLRSAVVFGGMNMKEQTLELKGGVEVLIATPGRLIDHIEAKNCNLSQVEYVVLDEADRMLDIGFLPDLQRILSDPAQDAVRPCCSRPPSRPRSRSWRKATCKTRCWSKWPVQPDAPPTSSSAFTASRTTISAT